MVKPWALIWEVTRSVATTNPSIIKGKEVSWDSMVVIRIRDWTTDMAANSVPIRAHTRKRQWHEMNIRPKTVHTTKNRQNIPAAFAIGDHKWIADTVIRTPSWTNHGAGHLRSAIFSTSPPPSPIPLKGHGIGTKLFSNRATVVDLYRL